MKLLAQRLQEAGLAFISARATHRAGGLRVDEIVCPTQHDVELVDAWAEREGFPVNARVATAEELADHERWSR